MNEKEKCYLGDNVYVSMINGELKLTTENDGKASNTIFLEPEIYKALTHYVFRVGFSPTIEGRKCGHNTVSNLANRS